MLECIPICCRRIGELENRSTFAFLEYYFDHLKSLDHTSTAGRTFPGHELHQLKQSGASPPRTTALDGLLFEMSLTKDAGAGKAATHRFVKPPTPKTTRRTFDTR